MTALSTNKLLEILKANPDLRWEFMDLAAREDLRVATDTAREACDFDYRFSNFKAHFDKDLEFCKKIIAQALDERYARMQPHKINEFIAFYIDRTTTRERSIGRSNGTWGSIIYESYHYQDPEPAEL